MRDYNSFFDNSFYFTMVIAWAAGLLTGASKVAVGIGYHVLIIAFFIFAAYILIDSILTAKPSTCVARALCIIPFLSMGYLSFPFLIHFGDLEAIPNWASGWATGEENIMFNASEVFYGFESLIVSSIAKMIKARLRRKSGHVDLVESTTEMQ